MSEQKENLLEWKREADLGAWRAQGHRRVYKIRLNAIFGNNRFQFGCQRGPYHFWSDIPFHNEDDAKAICQSDHESICDVIEESTAELREEVERLERETAMITGLEDCVAHYRTELVAKSARIEKLEGALEGMLKFQSVSFGSGLTRQAWQNAIEKAQEALDGK